jgi:non-specific serine/threonine protein kinase
MGDSLSEGSALNTLGLIAHGRGDYDGAERVLEEAIVAYRRADVDPVAASRGIAVSIDNLGSAAFEQGDLDRAEARFREALQLNQERGDLEGIAMNQLHIATTRSFAGDPDEGRRLLPAAIRMYADVRFPQYLAECLESACLVSAASNNPAAVARLLGASAAMRAQAGSPPVPFLARLRADQAEKARRALGEEAFQTAYDEGESMPTDAAVRWTLELLAR